MTASGYRMYSKSSRDSQYELIERYAPLVKRWPSRVYFLLGILA